jgi:hypothetical protein
MLACSLDCCDPIKIILPQPWRCVETDAFWIVYVQLGYQAAKSADHDPDSEGVKSGLTNAFKNETTDDVNCIETGYHEPVGGTGSIIFLETAADHDRTLFQQPQFDSDNNPISPPVRRRTAVHEVGHQFGLDGGETVAMGKPTQGFWIMSSPGYESRKGQKGLFWEPFAFQPRHINILRCRRKSPGRGPGDP